MELLPYCSRCLSDFDLDRYPYQLLCRHLYCSTCLPTLTDARQVFRCIYDGVQSPEEGIHSDVQLYHRIDTLRKCLQDGGQVDQSQLDTLRSCTNYAHVPCRSLAKSQSCSFGSVCPYDHSTKSQLPVNIAARTWECRTCLLTISAKLMRCPVCESRQEDEGRRGPRSTATRSTVTENRTFASLDQSQITDEEKAGRLTQGSRVFHSEDKAKTEEPVRSACCTLQ